MRLRIDSIGSNAIQVLLEGADYSIADVVHKELLESKHVKFAGVAPPHPLIKTVTIQLHTDGYDANKALDEALKMSLGKVSELLSAANQAFPEVFKSMGSKKEIAEGTGTADNTRV